MLSKYCIFFYQDYHTENVIQAPAYELDLLWNAYLWSEPQRLELILILSLMLEEKLFEQVELT